MMEERSSFRSPSQEARSRQRYRRAGFMAVSSAFARFATIATGFISVPLAMRYLGSERYGMWLTMSSLLSMLFVTDLGINDGLIEPLAASVGRGARDDARRMVSSAFFLLFGLSAVLLLLFAAAYPFVNWRAVFNVTSSQAAREAGPSAAMLVLCLTGAITAGIGMRINVSFQGRVVSNIWQTTGSVLTIVALLAVIRADTSLPTLVLVLNGGPLLAMLANGVFLFGIKRPWLRPRLRYFDYQTARSIFGTARWFFVSYLAQGCILGAGNMVIAQALGPQLVPEYGLPLRIFAVVSMAVGLLVMPLWPAYAEALERRDHDWVALTARRSIVAAGLVGLAGSAAVVLAGNRILLLWVGGMVTPSRSVWLGFGAWSFLAAIGFATSVLLWGIGAARFEGLMRVLQAVATLVLLIALTPLFGVAGSAWALAISEIVRLAPTAVFVSRFIRNLETRRTLAPVTLSVGSPSCISQVVQ